MPADDDEDFRSAWDASRDALAAQRGSLGTRLYRSVGPADFRFVEISWWSSPLMVSRAAADPEVRRVAVPVASHRALYQVAGH